MYLSLFLSALFISISFFIRSYMAFVPLIGLLPFFGFHLVRSNYITNTIFGLGLLIGSIPTFINFENKFFVGEILNIENKILDINNQNVKETITKQLKILNLIQENASLSVKISEKKFGEKEMMELSKKYNVPIEKIKIKNILDDSKFSKVLLEQI